MSGADGPAEAADEVREAEEAEQRALEEEEQLRLKVLAELQTSGTVFRSAPEDVLEFAIYMGMKLDEDKELLWIADKALQAEDPEGWLQCESLNEDLYYLNQVTMQVLWRHPLDYQHQQTYLKEKYPNGTKSDREFWGSDSDSSDEDGTRAKKAAAEKAAARKEKAARKAAAEKAAAEKVAAEKALWQSTAREKCTPGA